MMKTILRRLAAPVLVAGALAGAALLAGPASAHRGHDAMSVVELAADGVVTVSHRFEAHDIEPALVDIAPAAQPSLDDPDAVAALEAYVLNHFRMEADGKEVALVLAGADIGASEVRIAVAGNVPAGTKTLTLRSTILQDVYPSQVNQAIVHTGKSVRTLRFTGSEAQNVALD